MENQTELESIREDLMSSVTVNVEDLESDLAEVGGDGIEIEEPVEKAGDDSEEGDEDEDQDPRNLLSSYKKSDSSDGGSVGAYRGRFSAFANGYKRGGDSGIKPSMANIALYSGAGPSHMGPAAEMYAPRSLSPFKEASAKSATSMSPTSYGPSSKAQSSLGESAKTATDYSGVKSSSVLSPSISKSSSSGGGGYCCACAAKSISKLTG
jgi:hypothetical protein